MYKIIVPRTGDPNGLIIGKPKISEPNSCISNSYILILFNEIMEEKTANNIVEYLSTKFVRFLISLKSSTQDKSPRVYQFVPLQDFSKTWTDEELYKKYGLTQEEIDFIESMIKPME